LDFTSVGWLLAISITGYILVGLAVGAVVSNAVFKDGGSVSDARMFGGISAGLWPIASVVIVGGLLWHYGISFALTPQAHLREQKAKKEERKASGKPATGAYVD
jgi:nitrate reductase NapE component